MRSAVPTDGQASVKEQNEAQRSAQCVAREQCCCTGVRCKGHGDEAHEAVDSLGMEERRKSAKQTKSEGQHRRDGMSHGDAHGAELERVHRRVGIPDGPALARRTVGGSRNLRPRNFRGLLVVRPRQVAHGDIIEKDHLNEVPQARGNAWRDAGLL